MSVIAPFELDETVAAGRGAGQAQGRHRGLGAGAHQPHHLHRGQGRGDDLGELDLGQSGSAEGGAARQGLFDGRHDRRMPVAQDVGPVAADVVDVAPAVLPLQVRSGGGADEDRLAAHSAEGAHGGIDAAGKDALGAGEEGHGALLSPARALTPGPSPAPSLPTSPGEGKTRSGHSARLEPERRRRPSPPRPSSPRGRGGGKKRYTGSLSFSPLSPWERGAGGVRASEGSPVPVFIPPIPPPAGAPLPAPRR